MGSAWVDQFFKMGNKTTKCTSKLQYYLPAMNNLV
jgi:hypothetical protein